MTISGNLRAKNIIDDVVYRQEMNFLNKNSAEIREEISRLGYTEISERISQTEKLLKLNEIQDEFNEQYFNDFTDRIIIFKRNEFGFQLRCGLTLKEVQK